MTSRDAAPISPTSVIERIHHAAVTASPALQPVARWLASNALHAGTISIEEVASASGGSVSSVNRFARHAGYSGFTGLKADLAAAVRQALRPVAKLTTARDMPGGDGPEGDSDVPLVNTPLQQRSLDQAVQRIVASRAVYCLGLGQSNYLAGLLFDGLMPYHDHVVHVPAAGGTEQAVRHLTRIGPADILIAISLPRYSRDALDLVRFARQKGAHILGLTDSRTAPLVAVSDTVLLAPAAHHLLTSSVVAMVALMESLMSGVLRATPHAAELAADLSQAVLRYLSFEPLPGADGALG